MIFFNKIFFILIFTFLISCSNEIKKENILKENNIELQVLELYQEGLKSLDEGDVLLAAKKFNEAEILFPQSEIAPKSALMAAYSYYSQDYYGDAIAELDRFTRVYPFHSNIDYAYYLLAISYYEQIVDEKKDLNSIIKSKEIFEYIVKTFPNTDYAIDSEFKLNLVNEILAAKEIYIGRYYFEKKKWIPAINRFKIIVDKYQTTIYIEEALYRLVEIYYILGYIDEAKKYANVLGYNFQSSEWYERSYSIFDKRYVENKKNISKEKNSLIKKFKSLLD